MSETIFSKIIRGEIPCHRVYEDELVLAFLDIEPLSVGHVLVIPKQPFVTVDQMTDDSAAAVGRALAKISRALIAVTGVAAYNVLAKNGAAAQQAIPHVHFHIIPKYADGSGLCFDWEATKIDHAAGKALAAKIAEHL